MPYSRVAFGLYQQVLVFFKLQGDVLELFYLGEHILIKMTVRPKHL